MTSEGTGKLGTECTMLRAQLRERTAGNSVFLQTCPLIKLIGLR